MNITLIIGSIAEGGAERVVANLANYLVENKHNVTLITVSSKKSYYIDSRVNHIVLYDEKKCNSLKFIINIIRLFRLNKYFRKGKYDVILTFLPKLTRIILKQKQFIKAPVILAERGDPISYCAASDKNKRDFIKYNSMADAYVFQTKGARDFYNKCGIDVSKSAVIPNAINPEFNIPDFNGVRKKTIVSVGRLVEQKNFSLLISAFSRIANKYRDYTLEIYGEGPLKSRLIEETRMLGIEDRVIFCGYVSDITNCIKDAALFVLASNYEGMPNALMEAMAIGLPVISTDCPPGGPAFLIQDGINGFLVPVNDEIEMSRKMDFILKDRNISRALGNEAKKISLRLEHNNIYRQWVEFIYETYINYGG